MQTCPNSFILDIQNIAKKFHNLSKLWKMLTIYKLQSNFSVFKLGNIELCSQANRTIRREIYFWPFKLNISSDFQNESSKITDCIKKKCQIGTKHDTRNSKISSARKEKFRRGKEAPRCENVIFFYLVNSNLPFFKYSIL